MTQETLFLLFGSQSYHHTDDERAKNTQAVERAQQQLKELGFELGELVSTTEGGTFINVLKLPEGWTYQTHGHLDLKNNCNYNLIIQDAKGHLRAAAHFEIQNFGMGAYGPEGETVEVYPRFSAQTPYFMFLDNHRVVPDEYRSDIYAQIFDRELPSPSNGQLVTHIPGAELIVPNAKTVKIYDKEGGLEFCESLDVFAGRVLDKYLPKHADPKAYWGEDCSAAVANVVKAFADYRQNVFLPGVTRLIAAKPAHDPKP